MHKDNIRNIAIIAHVDHGKTTLVDRLLQATDTIAKGQMQERMMDNNELERERGITILSKNTCIQWDKYQINLIDTPGHADFGGEVERILSMVDAVLLIVDAVEGPMPQTRFVTQKSFDKQLNPIVVINKIDRDGARCDWVINEVFDLFDSLGASDKQLDFPVIYTSATQGYATLDPNVKSDNMKALLESIIQHVPPPSVDETAPLCMQISSLAYSPYLGAIGIGRIQSGEVTEKQPIVVCREDAPPRSGKLTELYGFHGLTRVKKANASAGDIVAIAGIENLMISDTICEPSHPRTLPALTVDKPTIRLIMRVNQSPFAGRDGKYLTSRKIQERLDEEVIHNVALRVEDTGDPDKFLISGRGELHLSILIETMRRQGYEFALSRPEVILKEIDDQICEPYENLIVEVPPDCQGAVMGALSERQGQLENIAQSVDHIRLTYIIPTRCLFGFQSEFQSLTAGEGIMYHSFAAYQPMKKNKVDIRRNGVLIANQSGQATGYALWNLQARGKMLIKPQTPVYEGMIIGIHSRENDLVVNVTKEKQLTNVRASGTDENIILTPPVKMNLEQALSFIAEDELLEVTPQHIRFRKKRLKAHERKRDK